MTTKELFLNQYNACYNEENWFVPLTSALDGLTDEQAFWKDGSSNHSIFELAEHMAFWNGRYLYRFNEMPLPEIKGGNESTFETADDDKSWEKSLKKLNEVMTELGNAFKNATDEKLRSSPFKDSDDPWYSVIANINIHNAYHIGQIVFLRKLQGSWGADRGVK